MIMQQNLSRLECPHCNEHPEGFPNKIRLALHHVRSHSGRTRLWIAVNPHSYKGYLAGCKACNDGKAYRSPDTVVAHLRRVHFPAFSQDNDSPFTNKLLRQHWVKETFEPITDRRFEDEADSHSSSGSDYEALLSDTDCQEQGIEPWSEPTDGSLFAPNLQEMFRVDSVDALRRSSTTKLPHVSVWDWSGRGSHVDFEKEEDIPLQKGRCLGAGRNGQVYETQCRGIALAWKQRLRCYKVTQKELREIDILKKLDHKHIVKLVGTYTHRNYLGLLLWPVAVCDLAIFFEDLEIIHHSERASELESNREGISERMEALNLWDYQTDPFSKDARFRCIQFLSCLASAVHYLHSKQIRHKDLKPMNILLRRGGLWLTDFDISTDFSLLSCSSTDNGERGTLKYFAPEVANYEKSGRAADIFSLGCIFLEIITLGMGGCLQQLQSLRPKKCRSFQANLDMVESWFKYTGYLAIQPKPPTLQVGPMRPDWSPPETGRRVPKETLALLDLIRRMISENPHDRPTALEVAGYVPFYIGSRSPLDQPKDISCCASMSEWPKELSHMSSEDLEDYSSDVQRDPSTSSAIAQEADSSDPVMAPESQLRVHVPPSRPSERLESEKDVTGASSAFIGTPIPGNIPGSNSSPSPLSTFLSPPRPSERPKNEQISLVHILPPREAALTRPDSPPSDFHHPPHPSERSKGKDVVTELLNAPFGPRAHDHSLGATPPRSLDKVEAKPQEHLNRSAIIPTTYEGWTLQKRELNSVGRANWSSVKRIQMKSPSEELEEIIKRRGATNRDLQVKFTKLTFNQRGQIERLVEDKIVLESDPKVQWNVAFLDTEARKVHLFSGATECIKIHVILKRSMKPSVVMTNGGYVTNVPSPPQGHAASSSGFNKDSNSLSVPANSHQINSMRASQANPRLADEIETMLSGVPSRLEDGNQTQPQEPHRTFPRLESDTETMIGSVSSQSEDGAKVMLDDIDSYLKRSESDDKNSPSVMGSDEDEAKVRLDEAIDSTGTLRGLNQMTEMTSQSPAASPVRGSKVREEILSSMGRSSPPHVHRESLPSSPRPVEMDTHNHQEVWPIRGELQRKTEELRQLQNSHKLSYLGRDKVFSQSSGSRLLSERTSN